MGNAQNHYDVIFYNPGYIVSDLKQMLKLSNNQLGAGPLLNTVMAGIDSAGGLLYGGKGWEDDSGQRAPAIYSSTRSKNFMIKKMKIPKEVAKLLYSDARCGTVHAGIIANGHVITRKKTKLFIRNTKGKITISVDLFANLFIKSLIWKPLYSPMYNNTTLPNGLV